jgi:RpiB/LacA/LacB family sugar-phosphate isomerase
MKSFLFLCTGNLCRSPMAAAFFEKALGPDRRCKVVASGLDSAPEQPPFDLTIMAMQEIGIDISEYRSTLLTPRMVEAADYIFCMTKRHVDWTNKEFPGAADKVFLLREFDDSLPPEDRDIRDPLGGNLDTHRLCRNEVQQAIDFLVKYLDRWDVLSDDDGPTIDSVALGSDHAGLELKEILKEHLQKRPIRIKDFGPASDLATDYPDYAKPVAEGVANGDYELGILVCGSGIGMSIAANKQPGVRAALVFDEEMAGLARRHNDANVLCLGARKTSPEQAIRMIDAYLEAHFEGGRHQRRLSKIENRT